VLICEVKASSAANLWCPDIDIYTTIAVFTICSLLTFILSVECETFFDWLLPEMETHFMSHVDEHHAWGGLGKETPKLTKCECFMTNMDALTRETLRIYLANLIYIESPLDRFLTNDGNNNNNMCKNIKICSTQ
jgi:hypothetical protein